MTGFPLRTRDNFNYEWRPLVPSFSGRIKGEGRHEHGGRTIAAGAGIDFAHP
ncbi:MAG: hypothetical protein ABL866_08315 [Devosia sp.]